MKKDECEYNLAWIGKCKNSAINTNNRCTEHESTKCIVCGKLATHECSETFQFVCGAPLCEDCEHSKIEQGILSHRFSHCSKATNKQQYGDGWNIDSEGNTQYWG
jgi:hypothetical protein